MKKLRVLGLAGAAGLLLATSLPASADGLFSDFFCGTLSIGCAPPPPPPPPPPPVVAEREPAKPVRHMRKKRVVKKAAPKAAAEAAPPAPAPAPQ